MIPMPNTDYRFSFDYEINTEEKKKKSSENEIHNFRSLVFYPPKLEVKSLG